MLMDVQDDYCRLSVIQTLWRQEKHCGGHYGGVYIMEIPITGNYLFKKFLLCTKNRSNYGKSNNRETTVYI